MLAGQSGRLSTWLVMAVLAALAAAAIGWLAAEATAQVENAPLRAPAKTGTPTVPDPIGDLDQFGLPTGKAGAAKPIDEKRMFYALLIVAGVFVIPVVLANYLSKALRMPDHFMRMAVVLFAILASSAATIFEWPPKLGIDLSGGVILIYEVEQEDFKEMDKLVSAVGRRVNPGGIKEVTVRPYGEREIEIIIPKADEGELERTKKIIAQQGQLEFRIVADDRYDKPTMDLAREPRFKKPKSIVYDTDKNDPEAKWVPVVPDEGVRLASNPHYATRQIQDGPVEALLLIDKLNVTGDYLTTANPDRDEVGKPSVSFGFNDRGANLFGKLTGANLPDPAHADLQRLLAIVLDGTLQSAPSIRSRIRDRGQITGSFTEQQVEELAAVLTAGRLPTTLRKEPTTSLKTGATLGADTIYKGELSMLVSTVAVVIFMVFYYRFAGVVANLALILNVLLIVAFMILFHAAFTLAGLAGLALTVGMAVDANVLIYERMREELGRGATLRMAIRNGFERATTTIVDANVTTLISAIVLYWIGTDQVKGFAVTLILGIVMNLFTAITFTRLLFDIAEKQRWITRLKMMHVLENPHFDFIGKRFAAIGLSLLLIGIGLVGVFERGRGLLDIDFTGGVSVEALFEQPQDVADVRERVKDLPDVTVQDIQIRGEPPGERFLIITSKSDIDETNPPPSGPKTNIEWVEAQLKTALNDAEHRLAFNHVSWTEIETVAQASDTDGDQESGADGKSGKAEEDSAEGNGPAEDESKPAEDKQSRYLPGDENLLALADDDADPAKTESAQSETATETARDAGQDGDQSAPKDQPPAAGAAAGEEKESPQPAAADPYADGSTTKLTFSEKVDHDTLERRINDALKATGHEDEGIRFSLDNSKYEAGSNRGFTEWTLKIALPADQIKPVLERVQQQLAEEPYFPSSNKVGASVAGNTQLQATYALLASLVLIVVYVWIRFQQVSFGFAAVLALVHDVLVALGGLALSFWLAQMPFMENLLIEPFKINLPIIAAFLTIIGYSINDTIVIFDRIREVRGKSPDMSPELVNSCINQTLSRTLLTSLTVFIVVLILYIFGGQGIHGFAFTLVIGTISGTYSTVYIATPVLIWMNRRKTTATPSKGAVAAVGRGAGTA
jgi:SecD/SecF fusion protein